MGSDNVKFAKPGRAKWQVVRRGEMTFTVYRPDGTVYDTFGSLQQASVTAGVRQREEDARARKTVRTCMCCQNPFESEGIHNRMCTRCRAHGADSYSPYGLAPRSGRPR